MFSISFAAVGHGAHGTRLCLLRSWKFSPGCPPAEVSVTGAASDGGEVAASCQRVASPVSARNRKSRDEGVGTKMAGRGQWSASPTSQCWATPPDFEATVAIRDADAWRLAPLPYSDSMIDAVALDRGGRIHLLVDQDRRLLYAEPLESGWKLHEVAFSGARAFALGVDAEGTVTILYYGTSRFALDPIHHLGVVRYNPSSSVQLAPLGPPGTPASHIRCDAIQLGTRLADLTVPNDEWRPSVDERCYCPGHVMKGSGSMSDDGWECVDAGAGKNEYASSCEAGYYSCCVLVDDDDRVTSVGEDCDPDGS